MNGGVCRCGEITRLDGPDSRAYADSHLIEREVGDGITRTVRDWGFGHWRCPSTGWQFESASHDDGAPRWLRRLPYTTPQDYLDHDIVARRAEEIAISHRLIDETFNHRSESEDGHRAWAEAAARGKEAREAMESPDLLALVQKIPRSDPRAIEAAIVYLEVDPWCFRSGYQKERILRDLSRARLSESDKVRVRAALVTALLKGPRFRPEFSAMRRLARHVRSPEFEIALESLDADVLPHQRPAVQALLRAVRSSRREISRTRRSRGGRRG